MQIIEHLPRRVARHFPRLIEIDVLPVDQHIVANLRFARVITGHFVSVGDGGGQMQLAASVRQAVHDAQLRAVVYGLPHVDDRPFKLDVRKTAAGHKPLRAILTDHRRKAEILRKIEHAAPHRIGHAADGQRQQRQQQQHRRPAPGNAPVTRGFHCAPVRLRPADAHEHLPPHAFPVRVG